jgi:hypothetical protein
MNCVKGGVAELRLPSLTHNARELSICRGQRPRLQFYLRWKIENAPVIYLAVKSWCFVFLACGIAAFSGCATDEEFNAAEASKTRETVPGEVDPNAPGASQQQVRTQPGFNF